MLYAVRYRFSNFLMTGFGRLIFALSGHNWSDQQIADQPRRANAMAWRKFHWLICKENGKLKRQLADLSLDRHVPQEIVRKKL
jgi:hypothetical protein